MVSWKLATAGQLWKEERSLTLERRVSFSLRKLAPRERENCLTLTWCVVLQEMKTKSGFLSDLRGSMHWPLAETGMNEWIWSDIPLPPVSDVFLHRRRYVAADCNPLQHHDHALHIRRHFSPFDACCHTDYRKINGLKFKMLEKSSSLWTKR